MGAGALSDYGAPRSKGEQVPIWQLPIPHSESKEQEGALEEQEPERQLPPGHSLSRLHSGPNVTGGSALVPVEKELQAAIATPISIVTTTRDMFCLAGWVVPRRGRW